MFCFIAFFILSILGIFSATHRSLAKEALDCVFRRVTLRPCNTGFKEKIKGKILSKLLDRSVLAARIFNKHFELLSWIFFILMIASTVWALHGTYNYYLYGNCSGMNQTGFCLLDPTGENSKITQLNATCGMSTATGDNLTLSGVDLSIFPNINKGANKNLVFIGCYECDYSRKVYPGIKKLVEKNNINYTFIHYPAKPGTRVLSNYGYCAYKEDPAKFWIFNDLLYQAPKEKLLDQDYIKSLITQAGLSADKILSCASEDATANAVEKQIEEMQKTNIYGTPTVFIDSQPIVGPKPYRVYQHFIKKFFFF